ncbi:MAG: polysaccharide deacetylase family protein [Sandaracinaceae bacterium]|nr:polysaccharide deacetylase family protein [Sandaracinaceae bacterium]
MTTLKPTIRDLVARVLSQGGLTSPTRRHYGKLMIVTFHRVLPKEYRDRYHTPGMVITPEELDWTVGYLKEHYTIGRLDEVHTRHESGERPDKPFLALTFDDGYRDNFVYGLPILEKHGVRACFFVTAGYIDRDRSPWYDRIGFALNPAPRRTDAERALLARYGLAEYASLPVEQVLEGVKKLTPQRRQTLSDVIIRGDVPEWARMMTSDEIRELHRRGHEIGSHTMTHPILTSCTRAELDWELEGAKNLIQKILDEETSSLAYPNGDVSEAVLNAVEAAGYLRAVTTRWGANQRGNAPYLLRRCEIDARRMREQTGTLSEPNLALRLSGFHPSLR